MMASVNNVDVNVKDIRYIATVRVRIRGRKRWAIRVRIATWLLHAAKFIAPNNITYDIREDKQT